MSTVEQPETAAPEATVLGRLLVIQQAIDAMPDESHIASFVSRALSTLPGVDEAWVDLEGSPVAPSARMAALKQRCEREISPVPVLNFMRHLGSGVQCFPIDAPARRLGWLLLTVHDEDALRPYVAFLGNIAGTMARILLGRHYQARLAQANEELREARDGLEQRVAERTRELEYRATHDQLTGLANRALLVDRLQAAIGNAQREGRLIAVVYLDLDSFTFLNTGLGNALGDDFLRETARRLRRLVRDGDTVARIGSDEFVILLTGLDSVERSSVRLSAMLAAVREPVPLAGKETVVTCSIGAAVYPLDGEEGELLLRRANSAMLRAKNSGKDSIQLYASTRDAAVAERMELETELRRAIPAGELVAHYQPKLDLATGELSGAEALVRWNHPRLGLLAPSRFIPIAEDSALIAALGERVLLQACLQARIWQEAGLGNKTVAVNLAARQLRDDSIIATVGQALHSTGLMPSMLELEITESSIVHDIGHATYLLHQLKDLGVAISIDDFGTGYSSLSTLRNFPVDKLKIDRSFIHEIDTVPSAAAVVLAVISFARTLGMRVIAEGVETADQAAFLHRHGCDEIQGYLVSHPLPPEQLMLRLREATPMPWAAP
ncbi:MULTISPECIES: bifunctional diguanylate cyclase/phosphodiesterase [unclassified Massilia]|uniref:putative bifunctional diguanylate cyclase/phosphodiesterase n=1 Tax=unclassified Massilia TaxID=2609279 RepID=UPI001B81104D|nr:MULTISPECIES: EAL domain-containing protein [unclassified Massilia]MBQ5938962.1 EAL domain-containing protein [Massilia sp. AB1]MBQ5962487.1 EAL domain-containing protein [Massilia sp. ZL223]